MSALLATFYQLYLQRTHNEKSLRPLGQIDLRDRKEQIYVYIRNNGMGPMIIDKLTFIKAGKIYNNIEDCVSLNPKSYMHIWINDLAKKVVLPNSHLAVFEKNVKNHSDEEIEYIRKELSPITLQVNCRDIYDNKFSFDRNFEWFSRHLSENIV